MYPNIPVYIQGGNVTEVNTANSIAVFICLFIVNFAYSMGPIAWLYPAEIFPLSVRGKGVSISTSADWLANFAVSTWKSYMILLLSYECMYIHMYT
jgi:hypothetical protein